MSEKANQYNPWKNPIEELIETAKALPESETMEEFCRHQLWLACAEAGLSDECLESFYVGLEYGPALDSLRSELKEKGVEDVDEYLATNYGLPNEKVTDW